MSDPMKKLDDYIAKNNAAIKKLTKTHTDSSVPDSGSGSSPPTPLSSPPVEDKEMAELKRTVKKLEEEKTQREIGERLALLQKLPKHLQEEHEKSSLEMIKVVLKTIEGQKKSRFIKRDPTTPSPKDGYQAPKYLNRISGKVETY